MGWKEEHGGKRPEDYKNGYEYRRHHAFKGFEDGCDLLCYFVEKDRGQKVDIVSKVAEYNVNYDKLVDRRWAVSRLKEIMFTKKGRLKKKYVDINQNQAYDTAALFVYLNQAISEGTDNVLLSWKEYNLLLEG